LFGYIEKGAMILNQHGRFLETTWLDLQNHNKNIVLDAFIVMPNHIHAIIQIVPNTEYNNQNVGAGPRPARNCHQPAPIKNDLHIPGADLESAPTGNHSLSEIVRQFKSFSTRRINLARNQKGCPVWQRSFYDHIIRNNISLAKIREYIHTNPATWIDDKDNPENPAGAGPRPARITHLPHIT